MRFITEFEIRNEDAKRADLKDYIILNQVGNRQIEMGQMLADSFSWQNPVNGNSLHWRLEIEAFPMDKWIEFKKRVAEASVNENIDPILHIHQAIIELESFGKPAGAAKEL